MTMEAIGGNDAIGGHDGMTVYRAPEGIRKVATTEDAWAGLLREAHWLSMMAGDHAPRYLGHDIAERWTLQEDMGHALSITCTAIEGQSSAEMYEDCVELWLAMRNRRIYHGDLTPPNLAWVEGRGLCALDFQESTDIGSDEPTKRDTTDAWQLLDTYMGLMGGCGAIQFAGMVTGSGR